MNLSYFIARRISREEREGFSSTIHKIAIVSIGVGLAAMLVSFLIMRGFQNNVTNKIYGFSGHLLIQELSTQYASLEERPMDYNKPFFNNFKNYPHVIHVQEYAHKAGLVKSGDDVLGVVFKGVGKSFNQQSFQENMLEGKFIHFPDSGYSKEVVLSKTIADKLNVGVGEDVIIHFFQDPPRSRKLNISGIYETNLSEYFDSRIIIGDIRMIQRLNNWADSIAGGVEVFLDDLQYVDEAAYRIYQESNYAYDMERVSDKYMQVFEWLGLVSRQVNILLVIILSVVCINMVSIVLILVMERTQMIGMLKALGANNTMIRNIFMYRGINLIVKGLLFGNILGLGLCYLQYKFEIVTLNAKDYYMSVVPVSWDWDVILLLNALTFVVVTLVLLLPTMIISRLNPIKSIRFD